jgi:hypothetical protein
MRAQGGQLLGRFGQQRSPGLGILKSFGQETALQPAQALLGIQLLGKGTAALQNRGIDWEGN